MFGGGHLPLSSTETVYYLRSYALVLLLALVLFAVGLSCLVMKAHNPFIYFNF